MAVGVTNGSLIADAHNVDDATAKFLALMKPFGVTDAKVRQFKQAIMEAEQVTGQIVEGEVPIEFTRNELKDTLGKYRLCADLMCNDMGKFAPALAREMRIGNVFPQNDTELHHYITGLDTVIKRRSAKLSMNGFGKEDQTQLFALMTEFKKQFDVRGKQRGKVRAERVKREAIFDRLRTLTSYFRRAGRAALHNSVDRSEFDRVKGTGAKKNTLTVVQNDEQEQESATK